MRSVRTAISVILLVLSIPAAASAATVDEILKLAKSGVSDRVILALIARDKTIFSIQSEQLVQLQRDGVSEPVILAMLKSGRAEAEANAQAEAAMNAAWFLATAPSAPQVLIVGASEAERQAERESRRAPVETQFVPYVVAVPVAVPVIPSRCVTAAAAAPQATSTRGIFFSQPSTGIFFGADALTHCR